MTRQQPGLPPRIRLSNQARDALTAAARTSRQTERGGILVGHRTPGGVYVEDTLAVSDPNAGHSHYVRRSKAARAILRDYVGVAEGCSTTGYVGEWHTHP